MPEAPSPIEPAPLAAEANVSPAPIEPAASQDTNKSPDAKPVTPGFFHRIKNLLFRRGGGSGEVSQSAPETTSSQPLTVEPGAVPPSTPEQKTSQ